MAIDTGCGESRRINRTGVSSDHPPRHDRLGTITRYVRRFWFFKSVIRERPRADTHPVGYRLATMDLTDRRVVELDVLSAERGQRLTVALIPGIGPSVAELVEEARIQLRGSFIEHRSSIAATLRTRQPCARWSGTQLASASDERQQAWRRRAGVARHAPFSSQAEACSRSGRACATAGRAALSARSLTRLPGLLKRSSIVDTAATRSKRKAGPKSWDSTSIGRELPWHAALVR